MGMGTAKKGAVMADINVTPLVDVMLVLLIIFMVTAPMMTQGVNVDLPQTTAKPLKQDNKPVVITIDPQGDIFFDQIKGDRKILQQQLAELAHNQGTEQPIFLRADKQVPYGVVAQVMADIKEAGFSKLGMVTQPEDRR
ncbi:MAG: protein TolR [Desulfobacteraceae bacterium]|nr:protein TolR [Desulfobacteraceae bacterium]